MSTDVMVRIGSQEVLSDERRQALEELIDSIRELNLDGEIVYRPPTERGATWYEVTSIYLAMKVADAATGGFLDRILDGIYERAITWAKKRSAAPHGPSQTIYLYGANGEILKRVRVSRGSIERT